MTVEVLSDLQTRQVNCCSTFQQQGNSKWFTWLKHNTIVNFETRSKLHFVKSHHQNHMMIQGVEVNPPLLHPWITKPAGHRQETTASTGDFWLARGTSKRCCDRNVYKSHQNTPFLTCFYFAWVSPSFYYWLLYFISGDYFVTCMSCKATFKNVFSTKLTALCDDITWMKC